MFGKLIGILAESFRAQARAAVNRSILQGAVEGAEDAFATLTGGTVELPSEATAILDVEPEAKPEPKKRTARAATKKK